MKFIVLWEIVYHKIEAYPSDDVQNPDYSCELWIAVEKK